MYIYVYIHIYIYIYTYIYIYIYISPRGSRWAATKSRHSKPQTLYIAPLYTSMQGFRQHVRGSEGYLAHREPHALTNLQ